jgi:hypothetical protein
MRGWRTFGATGALARKSVEAGVTRLRLEGHASPLRQQLLEQILHIIALSRPRVEAIGRRDRDLASQLRRALSSVALNLSEGFGTQAGNARLRFEIRSGFPVRSASGPACCGGLGLHLGRKLGHGPQSHR